MKKIICIISWFLLVWFIFYIFQINNQKSLNINIENIQESIVKIVPENTLIKYSDNPIWILDEDEYWIWTGFFIDKNWTILTSLHNISNQNINYSIITYDNNKYNFSILKKDEINDTAIIKIISSKNYNYLKLNKINNYKINDKIYSFWIKWKENQVSYETWLITNINNFIEFTPRIFKWFSWWPILNSNFEVIWVNYWIDKYKSYWIKLF